MSDLSFEVSRFEHLRRHLMETYPDIDDETLFDTLEGATSLNEAVGAIVRSALGDEALVQALKARIESMRERLSRIQHSASNKRRAALEAMERIDLKKIVEPDFTISVRPGSPGVVVTCEAEIPDAYKVPQQPKVDRRRILDALKHGVDVPGAVLSNSQNTLSVRTK